MTAVPALLVRCGEEDPFAPAVEDAEEFDLSYTDSDRPDYIVQPVIIRRECGGNKYIGDRLEDIHRNIGRIGATRFVGGDHFIFNRIDTRTVNANGIRNTRIIQTRTRCP